MSQYFVVASAFKTQLPRTTIVAKNLMNSFIDRVSPPMRTEVKKLAARSGYAREFGIPAIPRIAVAFNLANKICAINSRFFATESDRLQ